MLLLDLLFFGRIRLLLRELRVFLLLLLLNPLTILLLVRVKLILFLLVLPVQLAVRRGLHNWPRESWNLVRMNYRRRSVASGLWRRRTGVWISRMSIRRIAGRLSIRSYLLVYIRIRFIRRGRPVGAMVRCWRRIIRPGRPIGLHWFRNVARVRGTFRWPVSRRIVGLHSLGCCCLRRLIRGRRPVGLHRLR